MYIATSLSHAGPRLIPLPKRQDQCSVISCCNIHVRKNSVEWSFVI